jgi:hypothetical protein
MRQITTTTTERVKNEVHQSSINETNVSPTKRSQQGEEKIV